MSLSLAGLAPTLNSPSPKQPAANTPGLKFADILNEANEVSTPAASKDAASKSRPPKDDLYLTRGTYKVSTRDDNFLRVYEIKWKRVPKSKNDPTIYPPGATPVLIESLTINGKQMLVPGLKGSWRAAKSWMDSKGHIVARFVRATGKLAIYKSPNRQFTPNYRTLAVVSSLLKQEAHHVRKHGFASLPSAIKDKNGKIVGTRGTLLLAALIHNVGAKTIAHAKIEKKSRLASRLFDHINRLLKMKGMETAVKHAVEMAGLKVSYHKIRGRSLVQGESSVAGAARRQYNTPDDLVRGAPRGPWQRDIMAIALAARGATPKPKEIRRVEKLLVEQINNFSKRATYIEDLVQYFLHQDAVWRGQAGQRQVNTLTDIISGLMGAAHTQRAAPNRNQFDRTRAYYIARLNDQHRAGNLRVTGEEFVAMLDRLPGFELTNAAIRARARPVLEEAFGLRELSEQLQDAYNLHRDLVYKIFAMASVFFVTSLFP